jgi:hypothetical protein
MKKKVIFCAITLFSCACGTTKYVPIESTKIEYRDKIVKDSVFCYDSIFVKEKDDTLIFERYKYLYRDKIVRDSIFKCDTISVPFPVEVIKQVKAPLSSWQNFQVWSGRILLIVALRVGLYFVLRLKKILP